jgi:hypothetical protein
VDGLVARPTCLQWSSPAAGASAGCNPAQFAEARLAREWKPNLPPRPAWHEEAPAPEVFAGALAFCLQGSSCQNP